MGGNNPLTNVKNSMSNLSKGKNILSSALSLSSGGLIGSGEDTEQRAPSFEDRLAQLESAGAFGGMTMAQSQAQNQQRQDFGLTTQKQGIGFTSQAAENALSAMRGEQPSIANMQFQQNLQDSIASQNALAQTGGVDAALAYRIAAEQADKQRQAAVLQSAMLRAGEIQQGRQDLGSFGNALSNTGLGTQTLYGNQMANNIAQLTGTQAAATQQQQNANLANAQMSNQQMNTLIGAAGQGAGMALTSGIGAGSQAPGTTTVGKPKTTSSMA